MRCDIAISPERVTDALANLQDAVRQYSELRDAFRRTDAPLDAAFQKKFKRFYQVRRNKQWRDIFFRLLAAQKTESRSYEQVLRQLAHLTGQVEASFGSKLIATVDPDLPVIDSRVLRSAGLRLLRTGSIDARLNDACLVYEALGTGMRKFLQQPDGAALTAAFEIQFPNSGLTPMKMLDLVLWKVSSGSTVLVMDENRRLELIVEATKYCQRVRKMGMPSAAYLKALREPVHFLWERRSSRGKLAVAKYRSKDAVGRRAGAGDIVYDHAIPFSVLAAELLALNDVTPEAIRPMLERHRVVVLITKNDEVRLNKAGLGSTMPPDWDGKDPLARYRSVGINLVDNVTSEHL